MRTVPTSSKHLSLRVMHVAVVSTSLGIAQPEFTLMRCVLSVLPVYDSPKGKRDLSLRVWHSCHDVPYVPHQPYRSQRREAFCPALHVEASTPPPTGTLTLKPFPQGARASNHSTILHPNIKGCHLGPTSLHHYLDTTGIEESSCHVFTPFPSFQRRIAQVLHQPAQASHRCCT